MFFSKASFLLYYLTLYSAQTEALPQLLKFHLDSHTSSSALASSSPSRTALEQAAPTLPAEEFDDGTDAKLHDVQLENAQASSPSASHTPPTTRLKDSPTSTHLNYGTVVTADALLSSIWINLPPVSGFSWPGVILSAITVETIDLPPVSGFSWPGVAFETTIPNPVAPAKATASIEPIERPSSKSSPSKQTQTTARKTSSHASSKTSTSKPHTTTTTKHTSTRSLTTVTVPPQPPSILSKVNPSLRVETVSTAFTETLVPPVVGPTSGFVNQGIAPSSTSTVFGVDAASTNGLHLMPESSSQPDVTTGSEIALAVTIPVGILLICLVVWASFRGRQRKGSNPFSEKNAYNPASQNEDGGAIVRPNWYRNPVAPPPSVNPSPPNLDDLNDLVDNEDPFSDANATHRTRWAGFAGLKKLPWTFGMKKKQPVYPEVAFLYDTPKSTGSRNVAAAQPSSDRPSYESLSSSPPNRNSYQSLSAVSAPSEHPAYQSLTPNPGRNTWNTTLTRDLTSGPPSFAVSPIVSRTHSRPRASSVEMSPRVRYLHEGSDDVVMELLPEGIEDTWTPGEDLAHQNRPILGGPSPIPELPEVALLDKETDPFADAAAADFTKLARHGSVSRDFAAVGAAATKVAGNGDAGARPAPAWQRGRGAEGLGIDAMPTLQKVRTEYESPGWEEGRWRGPPRRQSSA